MLVQTLAPEAPAIRHAAAHDTAGFLAGELERRRALGYPPFSHLVRLEFSAAESAGRSGCRRERRTSGSQRCFRADVRAAGARAALPAPRQATAASSSSRRPSARRGVAAVRSVVDELAAGRTPARSLAQRRRRPAVTSPRRLDSKDDERGRRKPPPSATASRSSRRAPSDERAQSSTRRRAAPRGGAAAHPQVRRPGPEVAGLRDHAHSAPSSSARPSAWWRSCTTPWASGSRPPSSA